MALSPQQLEQIIQVYRDLIERYARTLVKNKLAANLIADEVFTRLAENIHIILPKDVRKFLQQSTKACSKEWLKAKKGTLFQRYPKNPT